MEVISFEMGTKTKLGRIIDKYDLSQKELAEFVDVTPASVNRWCNVVNGKVTQFEYKLIPDILNFFSSKGVNLHPNDFLDLEQYGVEKSKIPIRGTIQTPSLTKDEFNQKMKYIFILTQNYTTHLLIYQVIYISLRNVKILIIYYYI